MNYTLEEKPWWNYIEHDLRELTGEAALLVKKVESWEVKFHDYSFVVFPAAKAYEGFLKTLFLDLGFITEKDYYGKRFRVGKALNPALPDKYKGKRYVYDKMVDFCKGKDLPDQLWDTWKTCRNRLFHWFPDEQKVINFEEAKMRVDKVFDAMDAAFVGCKIDKKEDTDTGD